MIPNEPVLYPNFITEDERIALREHAIFLFNNNMLYKNILGPNRFMSRSHYDANTLTPIHKVLYEKVVNALNLVEPTIDPNLGILISLIIPGGFIHKHKDVYVSNSDIPRLRKFAHLKNKRNVRFNVMVERGLNDSYDPHINDKPFVVNKSNAWCFAASEQFHSTPVITGPENRIVYQFGFCLDAI